MLAQYPTLNLEGQWITFRLTSTFRLVRVTLPGAKLRLAQLSGSLSYTSPLTTKK